MKIVILDAYSVNPGDIDWAPIAQFGELTVHNYTPPELMRERMQDADIVLTNRGRLGENEFSAAPNMRFLGVFATGYDKIDLSAARRHNIAVCNVPGYSTKEVAQHAIALLLELTNRTRALDAEIRKGRWTQLPGDCLWDAPILSLSGKTFGVLGTGDIGCAAARIASALGMRIIGHSRSRRPEFCGAYVSREELFRASNMLSLHCAATDETRGIVNRETLSLMQPSAILINTARGTLVNSNDLAAALNENRLYAAGLDVVDGEPIAMDNPLLTARNCLITPHVAWLARDARQCLVDTTASNLNAFINGTLQNRVDREG